jgi:hypothetical protein
MKAVRNFDTDYFINSAGDIDDNGNVKMYGVEIQNEDGDVIEYNSFETEEEAKYFILNFN